MTSFCADTFLRQFMVSGCWLLRSVGREQLRNLAMRAVTERASFTSAQGLRADPDINMARWNNPDEEEKRRIYMMMITNATNVLHG